METKRKNDKYITTLKAAQFCDTTKETIQNLCRARVLKHYKQGKCYRVSLSDLTRYKDDILKVQESLATIEEYRRMNQEAIDNYRQSCYDLESKTRDNKRLLDEANMYPVRIKCMFEFVRQTYLGLIDNGSIVISEQQKKVLDRFIAGATFVDIENELGISQSNAKNHFRLAMMNIRRSVIKGVKVYQHDESYYTRKIEMLEHEIQMLKNPEETKASYTEIYYNQDRINTLNKRLDGMFTVRSCNVLTALECKTLRDVVTLSEKKIFNARNMGRKSMNEIKELLSNLGLKFAMTEDELDAWTIDYVVEKIDNKQK